MNYGSGLISQAEVGSVIPLLKPGQALNFKTRDESVPTRIIGYNFYDSGVGPVLGIPHVFRVEPGGQFGRAHQIAEQHSQVAALGSCLPVRVSDR